MRPYSRDHVGSRRHTEIVVVFTRDLEAEAREEQLCSDVGLVNLEGQAGATIEEGSLSQFSHELQAETHVAPFPRHCRTVDVNLVAFPRRDEKARNNAADGRDSR